MKSYALLILMLFNVSCSMNRNTITWYHNIVVNHLEKDSENPEQYRISLGISAQVFYLSPKTENYAQLLDKIKKSYQDQKPVKVGIEKNTNRIKEVVLTDKK